MKKTILLILTFMIPLVLSAGHWELREDYTFWGNSPPYIRFINDDIGYLNSSSAVYKTIDGGDTWEIIFVASSTIFALEIIEEGTFWIGPNNGEIILVTDDGANYEVKYQGIGRFYDIRFRRNYGVAVGRYGQGIRTIDGGDSWETILNNGSCLNRQIRIIHGHVLLVTGDETLISTDFGNTWQNLDIYSTTDGIYAFNENDIWIGGSSFIHHYDGYNIDSFYFAAYINPPVPVRAREVDFVNEMEGWFCTSNWAQPVCTGYIFHTTDGGESWQLDETNNTENMRYCSLCMINENKGFAGSVLSNPPYLGCLYEYKPDVDIQNASFVLDRSLKQNYPNPFNPDKIRNTKIQYSLLHKSNVSLKIYNIKGELVKTLVDEKKRAGSYTETWDGKDNNNNPINTGIYFYRLEVGNRVIDTKNCLILK